jgi:FAD/FMN-containing dehydrogenase
VLTSRRASAASDLRALLGADRVPDGDLRRWSRDASGARGLTGVADAVVLPRTPAEVAEVVRWCGDHDVPVVPRGGAASASW